MFQHLHAQGATPCTYFNKRYPRSSNRRRDASSCMSVGEQCPRGCLAAVSEFPWLFLKAFQDLKFHILLAAILRQHVMGNEQLGLPCSSDSFVGFAVRCHLHHLRCHSSRQPTARPFNKSGFLGVIADQSLSDLMLMPSFGSGASKVITKRTNKNCKQMASLYIHACIACIHTCIRACIQT